MILRPAAEIYRDCQNDRKLYVCHNYPACNTYVAAHPGTNQPMGVPANGDLRNLRIQAHRKFDRIWQTGIMTRENAYGMTIEAATAAAIHRNKHLLKGIAAERILVELTKMLCAQGAAGVLRDFADVLAVPIPELTPMFGFPQHNPHHDKDVWDHTIAVIESITPEPVLRWAALLHDIGKPSCFSLAEDGIGHFFGHSDQSTSMAESILSRLRFDNASKEQIVRLVRYHDMPITADRKPIKRLLSKHGEDATRQLIELHKADTLGQSAICRHRIAIFEEVSQMINEILQEESCFTLKDLAVNGHDMMTLGFQGPTIGRVLQECLDAVLDEQIPNEHEALMAFAKDRQLKS